MTFSAVILAGGRSSRMGSDKAQLILDNQSLLQRTRTILKQAGANEILVSRNDGQPGHLPDIYPDCGPLGGIYSALVYTASPTLFVPVDMPMMTADTLSALVEYGTQLGCSCYYQHQYLPLFIDGSSHSVALIDQQLRQEQDYSLRTLLFNLEADAIAAPEKSLFSNCNTPQQWLSIKQQFHFQLSKETL